MRSHATRHVAAATLAAALAAVLLSSCSSADDDAPDPTPDPTPSGTATAGAVPSEGPLTASQACAAMYLEGDTPLEQSASDSLVAVSKGLDEESAAAATTVAIQLGSLATRVPAEFDDAVAQIRVPFLQLQKALDEGTEESIDLDVASAHDGLVAYRALCEDEGYAFDS